MSSIPDPMPRDPQALNERYPIGEGFRSILRSLITATRGEDQAPGHAVPLEDVPVLGVRTRPLNGLSLYYGKSEIAALFERLFADAEARDRIAFEVQVQVDVTSHKPAPFIRVDDLLLDAQRPEADRTHYVIHLPRAAGCADAYLRELLRLEVSDLERGDPEIESWRFSKIVSRYPHLIDHLAAHPALCHVIMFIWECDAPGPVGAGGVVQSAKIATLYRPERIAKIQTINSDYLHAVLPELDGAAPNPSAAASHRASPGMGL